MRAHSTALAAGLALAFAAGASAAVTTTTTTSRTPATPAIAVGNGTTGTFVNNAPALTAAPAPAATSTTTSTTTTASQAVSPPYATTTDFRNQQTLAATAGTHASGSTSAIDSLLAQQAANLNPSTTQNPTTGSNAAGVVNTPLVGGYAFGNPSDVTALPYAAAPVTLASNTLLAPDVVANSMVTMEAARSDASVNRAIAQVQRDRKRVGRNGQLLYSIAPRTNVDRSAEMPDDGPPPSLTGSYSTLVR